MEPKKEIQFNEVYQAFFPKMVRFAGQLCKNKDEAEDVTQEAFVKAYRHFEHCEDGPGVKNWLMRIVYNTFLDHRRKQQRRVVEASYATHEDFGMDDFADPSSNAEQILLGEVMDPILTEAILQLDESAQELLKMAYVEQLSHGEIGQRLGIRAEVCRSRVHRLCVHLRKQIGNKILAKNQAAKELS